MPNYNAYGNIGGMAGYPQPNYYNSSMPDRYNQSIGQYQQPQPAQQPANNGIIWVQGEEGAKAYMVAPGNTVQLWDSENPTIYLKSADMSGMPSMRILDWTERTTTQRTPLEVQQADFVTREEFTALEDKLNALLSREHNKPTKTAKVKEDTDNG